MELGDKVRLNRVGKDFLADRDSGEHVAEFKDCVGNIIEIDDEFADVRWQPSGLRYFYPLSHLEHTDMAVEHVVKDGKTWSRPSDIRFGLHRLVESGKTLDQVLELIRTKDREALHRALFDLTEEQANRLDERCPRSIDLTLAQIDSVRSS